MKPSFSTPLTTLAALAALGLAAVPAAQAQTVVTDFKYTGSLQYFTVPTGVSTLFVQLDGAGGGGGSTHIDNAGGSGALVSGNLSVFGGEMLTVLVGGGGGNGPSGFAGGFGGGGRGNGSNGTGGGGGGGGRSALENAQGSDLADAGGGGGGGGFGFGGSFGGNGSASGMQTDGGGELSSGGGSYGPGSGGGGGGYFGGGGGAFSGGSGGTSLYTNLTGTTQTDGGAFNGSFGQGRNGSVMLRYAAPAAVPEASTTVSLGLLLTLGLGGMVVAAKRRTKPTP